MILFENSATFRNRALPWCHTDCTIEPDDLAIEITVLDDVLDEIGILIRLAQPFRKRDCGCEGLLNLLWQAGQHRRGEYPGRDGHHPDPELSELARRRQRQRHDTSLGGRISSLADLTVIGG